MRVPEVFMIASQAGGSCQAERSRHQRLGSHRRFVCAVAGARGGGTLLRDARERVSMATRSLKGAPPTNGWNTHDTRPAVTSSQATDCSGAVTALDFALPAEVTPTTAC